MKTNLIELNCRFKKEVLDDLFLRQGHVNEFPLETLGKPYPAKTFKFLRVEAGLNLKTSFYEGKLVFEKVAPTDAFQVEDFQKMFTLVELLD